MDESNDNTSQKNQQKQNKSYLMTMTSEKCSRPFKETIDQIVMVNGTLNQPISYITTMTADGGHLDFPIGTKNILFIEVHPMITHAMNQFNYFLTRIALKVYPIETNYLPVAVMLNFRSIQKHRFCRAPSVKVHVKQFQRSRSICEKLTTDAQ